jgi:hypothetical protein
MKSRFNALTSSGFSCWALHRRQACVLTLSLAVTSPTSSYPITGGRP